MGKAAGSPSTAVALIVGVSALACGEPPVPTEGSASDVRIAPVPCEGGYQAEIDYQGFGVTALVNGELRETLPTRYAYDTHALTGWGQAGDAITVTARGTDGAEVAETLVLPAVRPPVEVTLERGMSAVKRIPRGAEATVGVSGLLGGCPMEDWSWTATLPDGSTYGPEPELRLIGPDIPLPRAKTLGEQVVKIVFTHTNGTTYVEEVRYDVVVSADGDKDGHDHEDAGGSDCDDADRSVHPGATEREDGKDQDCNGRIDDHTEAYDDDGDGVTERDGDCDDSDVTRAAGLAEAPDCRDNDCDGEVDEGLTRPTSDDWREPNDTLATASDLGSSPVADLEIVTRDGDDEEWFRFYAKDHELVDEPLRALGSVLTGSLDGWRLKVVAHQLPDDAVYRVEFWHGGAKQGSGTLSGAYDKVRMDGSVLRDESGEWHVRIVPVKAPLPYCPASFRIRGD